MKACSKCGEEKPLDDFYRDKSGKSGRSSRCKTCANAHVASWKAANSERHRIQRSEYYRANRDVTIERAKAHYRENRDAVIARSAAWRVANPEKYLEHNRIGNVRRRARLREASSEDFTLEDLLEFWPCGVRDIEA